MPMVVFALARELQVIQAVQALTATVSMNQALNQLRVWKTRQAAVSQAASRLAPSLVRQALVRLSDLDIQSKSSDKAAFWLNLERLCVALASDDPRQAVA